MDPIITNLRQRFQQGTLLVKLIYGRALHLLRQVNFNVRRNARAVYAFAAGRVICADGHFEPCAV